MTASHHLETDLEAERCRRETAESLLAIRDAELKILQKQIATLTLENRKLRESSTYLPSRNPSSDSLPSFRSRLTDDELVEELLEALEASEDRCKRRRISKEMWKKKARTSHTILFRVANLFLRSKKEMESREESTSSISIPSSPESLGEKEAKKKRKRFSKIMAKTFARAGSMRAR
ncbi:hypothetical protein L596_018874 [Steinernema carpocapsae]|uniref:Uncharacterized protein n=1 Tax=Steinernema carpocapsae TaxID=34508 RepID=A0A4U5N6F2_STECR|nr:hypothetical protein L596_018874 [Steinernema carpocapsae]